MSGLIKRWFGGGGSAGDRAPAAPAADWAEVRQWAAGEGHRFAKARGGEGFVVEVGSGAGANARIEWAPSQRNYISGQELRVRADVGAADGVQMLVATRALIARLEKDVFEQFTEGNETRIDDDTPEEMRWVVLYPQVPGKLLGTLRARFGLLSNRPSASTLWLDHGLSGPLAESIAWHAPTVPLVLVVQRGRFVLRMALPEPRIAAIDGALALGLAAAAAARRVAADVARGAVNSQRPSTWGPARDVQAREQQQEE
jgi:hypothetical protein